MKKIITVIPTLLLAVPMFVQAASFQLTPSTGSYVPGVTFNVAVSVQPVAGEEITTAKLAVSFPPNVVEVVSFTPAAGWLPLTQPGYDAIDNTAGKLIKTGGFPAKVTSPKPFGTITLRAKQAGLAIVSEANGMLLLNPKNTNLYTGMAAATYTIATPEVVPAVVPTPKAPVVVTLPPSVPAKSVEEPKEEIISPIVEATTTATSSVEAAGSSSKTQVAAASDATDGQSNSVPWRYAIGGILLLVMFSWFLKYAFRTKK